MATAKILEEHLTCSICCEKTTSPAKCQVCQDKKKSIKCKCVECEEYMCSDCEKAHKGSKLSRSHKIIQNKEVIKQSRAEITGIITNLKKTKKSVSDKSSMILKSVDGIQEAEKKQIGDITKSIDDVIKKLQQHQTRLIQEAKDGNLKITHSLKTMCERLQKHESQIQSNMDFLTDLLKSEDIGTLAEMVVSVRSSLEKDEGQIRADLEAQGEGRSPVRVVMGGDWDPGMYIRVEVDEGVVKQARAGRGERVSSFSYTDLLSGSYTQVKYIKFDYPWIIQKIVMINNELWCCIYDAIHIYTRDCEKVREIKLPDIKRYTGLIECESGVAVAGHESSGLHLLNFNGAYVCKIGDGSFSDVSAYGGRLYALECGRCKVIVYECVRGEWRQVQEFSLEYNNGCNLDRICAHSGDVLVSSYNNDRLYLYSDSGALIQQTGEGGSGQPGKLDYPFLCGVDGSGTALVADYDNSRLQLYTAPSTWQVVTGLPGEVRRPVSAVVENRAGDTYIWVTGDSQLYKFRIQ